MLSFFLRWLLCHKAGVEGVFGDVVAGDVGGDLVEIAFMLAVASFRGCFVGACVLLSTLALSVVSKGSAADAKERDLMALGGPFSMLVEAVSLAPSPKQTGAVDVFRGRLSRLIVSCSAGLLFDRSSLVCKEDCLTA